MTQGLLLSHGEISWLSCACLVRRFPQSLIFPLCTAPHLHNLMWEKYVVVLLNLALHNVSGNPVAQKVPQPFQQFLHENYRKLNPDVADLYRLVELNEIFLIHDM